MDGQSLLKTLPLGKELQTDPLTGQLTQQVIIMNIMNDIVIIIVIVIVNVIVVIIIIIKMLLSYVILLFHSSPDVRFFEGLASNHAGACLNLEQSLSRLCAEDSNNR